MSVHKAITEHSQKQHKVVSTFLSLEQQRELYIEEAISLCNQGQPFNTDSINAVTKKINELAQEYGYVPARKFVTVEMVKEFVERK